MTPTQLDEASQALQQPTDCHDDSVDDQPEDMILDTITSHTEEPDTTTFGSQGLGDTDTHSGGVSDMQDDTRKDNNDTTLEDDTPNGLPDDDDDDGNHSDRSNDGLCIDYQSDAETEG